MVTYVCRITGWTADHVLQMPARRFFAMYIELANQEQKTKASFFYDLCDVQAIAICDSNYYKELKEYFRLSSLPIEIQEKIEKRRRHIFNSDDPEDSKKAAQALRAILGKGMVVNG
ncbi:MAG TPA: hypothetical protein DGG95_00655 [Cytophagales bacterium]|jgi:hypothetical protein|nr:hypothetical protein [Cytophagales bacterium]